MKIYKKKSLYFWILLFTGVFAIFLNAFVLASVEDSVASWIVLLILAVVFLDEQKAEEIINEFKSDEFSKKFDYYFKCFLLNLGLTMFLTMAITLFYYSSSNDTPVSIISYIIFIAFSLLIYFNKKFNFYKVAICESNKKVEKK